MKLPGAFGFAVIGLTVLVRLVLHPFFKQQLEMSKKMQEMKPHLDRLSKEHKDDKNRLQQEQLKLYQQAGINPASGCIFMIVQIPVFIGLYNTLSLFLMNGNATKVIADINKALYWPMLKIQAIDPWFFGFNLAVTPAKGGQWYYYLIPVLTGILQYLQVQVSMPQQTQSTAIQERKPEEQDPNKKPDDSGDFQKAMNTQMKYIFPFMIGWFSYTLPVGLSLYWNIFSLFSILQYRQLKSKK
jgi:YidC/Oxa1 family membrane protein insertase